MNIDTTKAITIVNSRLSELGEQFAFLGGAIVGFLVDDPAAIQIRPTMDVDVVIDVLSRIEYTKLEERLRGAGFKHDVSEGAPICRWIIEGIKVDIMPDKPVATGMGVNWFSDALKNSQCRKIDNTTTVKVISVPYFIATKIEAFNDRGKNDFMGSHDLEDIIAVVDGRRDFVEQITVAKISVRTFISEQFARLLANGSFQEALSCHLPPDSASQQRVSIVRQRMERVASLSVS